MLKTRVPSLGALSALRSQLYPAAAAPFVCQQCSSRSIASTTRIASSSSTASASLLLPSARHRRHDRSRASHGLSLACAQRTQPRQWQRPWHRPQQRANLTIDSVTAVNAARPIPLEHRELYDALTALEHSAGAYVNLSQLQLALRGLESVDSVTRMAGTCLCYI